MMDNIDRMVEATADFSEDMAHQYYHKGFKAGLLAARYALIEADENVNEFSPKSELYSAVSIRIRGLIAKVDKEFIDA